MQTGSDSKIHVDDPSSPRLRLTGGFALDHKVTVATDGSGERMEITTAPITGTGELRKEGNGRIEVKVASPDYSGTVRVTNGYVEAWTDNALGTGPIIAESDGTLLLRNGVTLPNNITISTDGDGTAGAIRSENNTNTLTGTVTSTNNNSRIHVNNTQLNLEGPLTLTNNVNIYGGGTLNVTGQVSGAGGLNKNNAGTTILDNDTNSFTGPVNINGGVLQATSAAALGNPSNISVNSGTTLDVFGDGTLNAPIDANDGTIANSAAGTTLTLEGPVTIPLIGDVTFAGDGDIVVNDDFGHGGVPLTRNMLTAEYYDGNRASSVLGFSGDYTLNSDGTLSQTTGLLDGTKTVNASGYLTGAANFDRDGGTSQSDSPMRWTPIFGSGVGGDHFQMVFTGQFTPDVTGAYTFFTRDKNGTGTGVDDDASFWIDANADGDFDTGGGEGNNSGSGFSFTTASLTAGQKYTIALGFDENTGDDEVSYTVLGPSGSMFTGSEGTIINPSAQPGRFTSTITPDNNLIKDGTGTLTLEGDNNYDGTTSVNDGTLLINGTTSGQGDYIVASGATLGGSGTIGLTDPAAVTMQAGSIISPGVDGVDTLSIDGDMTVEDGTTYAWELGTTGNDVVDFSGADDTLTFAGDWTLQLIDDGGESNATEKLYLFTGFETMDPDDPYGPITSNVIFDISQTPASWWTFTDPADLWIGRDDFGLYLTGLQTVPEPSTLLLMGLGVIGLLGYARRRRLS